MGTILWFIVVGLAAGLLARALMPGRQSMGLVATMLLGIVGSFVGGFIGALFTPGRSVFELRSSNIIMSVVGAIVVLLVVGWAGRSRRIHA